MKMTKKQINEASGSKEAYRIEREQRAAAGVLPDVPIPVTGLAKGWLFNTYRGDVDVACSTSIYHAYGKYDETTSQGARELFSTKLLALRALRYEMALKFAASLTEIDARIHAEQVAELKP